MFHGCAPQPRSPPGLVLTTLSAKTHFWCNVWLDVRSEPANLFVAAIHIDSAAHDILGSIGNDICSSTLMERLLVILWHFGTDACSQSVKASTNALLLRCHTSFLLSRPYGCFSSRSGRRPVPLSWKEPDGWPRTLLCPSHTALSAGSSCSGSPPSKGLLQLTLHLTRPLLPYAAQHSEFAALPPGTGSHRRLRSSDISLAQPGPSCQIGASLILVN